MLARFDVAVGETRRVGGLRTALRVACTPYLSIALLLRFLEALRNAEPTVAVQVTHLFAHDQVRLLGSGDIDLGILRRPDNGSGLELEALFPGEPLAAYLARDHHLASKRALRPDDVRNETLVMFPRIADLGRFDRALTRLEESGYRFGSVEEAGGMSPRDLLVAVARNRGIAIAPLSLKDVVEVERVAVRRPLASPVFLSDIVLAVPANPPRQLRPLVAVARRVARELRQAAESPLRDGAE